MDVNRTADLLNQLLVNTFAELGVAEASLTPTILIKDRYFVGHHYRCGGLQAVVLAGAKEIEFCDEKGALLKSVRIESPEEEKAA
jgi:hypothetical protein